MRRASVGRAHRFLAAVLMLGMLTSISTCDFTDLTAPTGASISINANPTAIDLNGDTSEITVILSNADGSPVREDTQVFLTTTLGTIPTQVGTVGGVAKALLTAQEAAGTATVTARSGSAEISASVDVLVGAVPQTLTVNADPADLPPGGGTTVIRAVVLGDGGRGLPGVEVTFSASTGTLRSGGLPRETDSRGVVEDRLTTTEAATVTVRTASLTETVSVSVGSNEPPTARFTFEPSVPRVGVPIEFNAGRSSDPDGRIVEYEWSWGDGTSPTITGSTRTTHTFTEPGTYTITLVVTDDEGGTGSTSLTIDLTNEDPIASFTFSPSSPTEGEAVTFDASSSLDRDGFISQYRWDWGDGTSPTISSSSSVKHTFETAGSYSVRLTVRDDAGAEATETVTVTVSAP